MKTICTTIQTIVLASLQFNGVTNRQPYWTYFVFYILIRFVIGTADAMYTSYVNYTNHLDPDGFLFEDERFIIGSILFIPLIAATVRRIRDVGYSPWLTLLPMVNFIVAALPSNYNSTNIERLETS